MKAKTVISFLWLITVTLLLSRLGMTRQALIFDAAIVLVLLINTVGAYFMGKRVKVAGETPVETVRTEPIEIYLKGTGLLSLIPHNFHLIHFQKKPGETGEMKLARLPNNRLELVIYRRGRYEKVLIQVKWGDPLGFFTWTKDILLVQTLWVYPKATRVKYRSILPANSDEYLVEGGSIAEARRIHWRAAARTGRLLLRQRRRQPNLCLLVLFSGDKKEDTEVADLAASWWKSLSFTGFPPDVIVAGKKIALVKSQNRLNQGKVLLRALARAEGPFKQEALWQVIRTVNREEKVILLGELPQEMRGWFSRLEVGG